MFNKLFIYTFLIVIMFLLSGLGKAKNINTVAMGLKNKLQFNLPDYFFTMAIILVIILQVFASIILLYSTYSGQYRNLGYYSALSLAGFTVLATLIYHYPPYGKEYYKFMSNLSVLGGLLLLSENLRI